MFKKKKHKIFCIGQNKTGTTSLQKFFKDHGFKVGNQRNAELLLDDYINRHWQPILKYCKTADVFQDIPFSNEYLYVLLDYHFPNSKFILSVRSTPEEWYKSITSFHSKLFGSDGKVPTKEDLLNGNYIYKGFIWKSFYEKFGEFENDIYNKNHLIQKYLNRNQQITDYFNNKNNLLVIDISKPDAISKISQFLNMEPKYDVFPWKNKTSLM